MPFKRLDNPCFEATCDNCGKGDNEEYDTSFHHPDKQEAISSLRDSDWTVELDDNGEIERILCFDCAEEIKDEEAREETAAAGGKEEL